MKGFKTVVEASAPDQLDRSLPWIHKAIKLGRINVEKVGKKMYLISDEEIQRIKDNPFTISKKEMAG